MAYIMEGIIADSRSPDCNGLISNVRRGDMGSTFGLGSIFYGDTAGNPIRIVDVVLGYAGEDSNCLFSRYRRCTLALYLFARKGQENRCYGTIQLFLKPMLSLEASTSSPLEKGFLKFCRRFPWDGAIGVSYLELMFSFIRRLLVSFDIFETRMGASLFNSLALDLEEEHQLQM